MTKSPCPQCGAESEGNFCATCGTPLAERSCATCQAPAPPGNRFCTECGSPIESPSEAPGSEEPGEHAAQAASKSGARSSSDSRPADLGWWVAGGLFLGLLLLVAYPTVFADDEGEPEVGGADGEWADAEGGLGPAPNVDISGMSTREAADALFDRAMDALSAGDSAQVTLFLPKAVEAYEQARPLDADGKFHLSLLQRVGFQFEQALATAEGALDENPDHLLNRWAAAAAAADMGAEDVAREHYAHLMEVWDRELERGRPEYEAHRPLMETIQDEAREFLNGDG